jgi:hypothetical protein
VVVFSLVYSSTTDHDWSQDELLALLSWSRDWNAAHGVTGLLLYRDCVFMQLLEGDEQTVRGLFARISADRRHQDVNLMWTTETPERRFADWTMAFRELAEHPVLTHGYNDALNVRVGRRSPRRPNAVSDLLSMFRPD